jgi:hypothetical protein
MTEQHPITPPPELVQQWANASAYAYRENGTYEQHEFALATQAARWGADMELEACCEWVEQTIPSWAPHTLNEQLRAARRPKPPSLKEQALQAWAAVEAGTDDQTAMAVIRRALDALPND